LEIIELMIENLWLVHPDALMCAAFRERFEGLPGVRIVQGRFEDLEPHDCFVTAGNAFGIMTAGIDAAVVRAFGDDLMHRIQQHIRNAFFGEQPVGTAFVVPTNHIKIPFVVHAPTMRVPGSYRRVGQSLQRHLGSATGDSPAPGVGSA
jgi:O-acetyl-ADP-ribose deacetylase (regulator of RNase III)